MREESGIRRGEAGRDRGGKRIEGIEGRIDWGEEMGDTIRTGVETGRRDGRTEDGRGRMER